MMNTDKESFGSRIGFVLAAAGSSVGLGNIWRFPYLAAEYGGGTFLIMYIFLAVTFGFTLTLTDLAIGRRTGKSVLAAYGAVEKKFASLGWIAVAIPAIMLSYYCDIGGWVLRYALVYAERRGEEAANAHFTAVNGVEISFFEQFISGNTEPVIYFIVFLAITTGVIMFGVQKGIEKALCSEFRCGTHVHYDA